MSTPIRIILSGHRRVRSPRENDIANRQLEYIARQWLFTRIQPVLGRFNEVGEEGFCIDCTEEEVGEVKAIAQMFQQDSILIIRFNLQGTLLGFLHSCVGGNIIPEHFIGIGKSYTAPPSGDWTFIEGKYLQFR